MEALQIYWWFIISLLGGILVFLLFVQGGQTMIWGQRDPRRKSLIVNALGRKWELTFTTLVTFRGGFWWAGIGVVLVVTCLFCISGYNDTAFLPSTTHPESSLFITNASSSEFTLTTMAWVTLLLPIVIGYIAYVWHKMTNPAITAKEVETDDHKY